MFLRRRRRSQRPPGCYGMIWLWSRGGAYHSCIQCSLVRLLSLPLGTGRAPFVFAFHHGARARGPKAGTPYTGSFHQMPIKKRSGARGDCPWPSHYSTSHSTHHPQGGSVLAWVLAALSVSPRTEHGPVLARSGARPTAKKSRRYWGARPGGDVMFDKSAQSISIGTITEQKDGPIAQ
jgi:hypothetical protein